MSFTFSHRRGVWSSEYLSSLSPLGGDGPVPVAVSEVDFVKGALSRGTTFTFAVSSKGALPTNEGVVRSAGSGWGCDIVMMS
jgi:hypothetical protein